MNGKIMIVEDAELFLIRQREMLNKRGAKEAFRIIALAGFLPTLIVYIIGITISFTKGQIPILGILNTLVIGWLFIFSFRGYWKCYNKTWKKRMKKISFPIEQTIEFNEDELIIRRDVDSLMLKLAWNDIDTVCENDNYWFLGERGFPIDKTMLTLEQYQFISEKCHGISGKNGKEARKGKKVAIFTCIGIWLILISSLVKIEKKEVSRNNYYSGTTLESRQEILSNLPDSDWKIHTETKLENYIFSSISSEEMNGIAVWKPQEDKEYELGLIASVEKGGGCVYFEFPRNGKMYYLFWLNQPDLDYAEVIYTVNGKQTEPIRYDAKEIVWTFAPNCDYMLSVYYYDKNGNLCGKSGADGINQFVMINGTLYSSTGKESNEEYDGIIDGEIVSSVSRYYEPTKHNQSNFGIGAEYKFVDDNVVIHMGEKWIVFEPEKQ